MALAEVTGLGWTSRSLLSNAEVVRALAAETLFGAVAGVPVGVGTGTFDWTGAGVGSADHDAIGTGAFDWAGVGAGETERAATGAGAFDWTGVGVGVTPTVDDRLGVGTGDYGWIGSGSGSASPAGSGTGAFTWTGAGSGTTDSTATGAGAFDWTGTGVGVTPAEDGTATGTGTFGWVGLGFGSNDEPTVITSMTWTPVGILSSVPLLPVTPLDTAVPITRVSILAPDLSADYPAHPAPGEAGAPEVVEEIVGYPQLFIGGRNVTNLRGVQTIIHKWASEAPFGDTAAAWEFPQKNPWDKMGEGDFDFLARDARVAIGMREETAPGVFRIRRLWSGFYDARGSSLGQSEDYFFEAKGTFWQAASQCREPHAITDPVDIGVWIARVLNAVEGRRWATMPLIPIGIPTTTRGFGGQYVMDYVQELLSEAITSDLRQWSLVEILPGVPRLVLKPAPSTVHATVAYGTPGVEVALRLDESTRVDRIFMHGIGKDNGGWRNVYYPWIADLYDAPYYPKGVGETIGLGDTDADTTSGSGVTDFQRRVDELEGFANPAVSGVMSAAWMAVVDDLQRRLHISVGPLNAATWERLFDGQPNPEAVKPRRLPMASKIEAEKYLYNADGKRLPGTNPEWDGRVPREIDINVNVGMSKAEGFKLARKLLGIYGEPAHNGEITWVTDPREIDRTRLTHQMNVKVTGYEGDDVVVQVSSVDVELDTSEDGPAYVVNTRVDERARDAMVVEDLLDQRAEAKADPSRRPGVINRSSRQVPDQRMPWETESKCGRLKRTPVSGSHWKIAWLPFAERGKLARIELHSDQPFMFGIFASLRITGDLLDGLGNPWADDDFWRDNKAALDPYGVIEGWGVKDQGCGYSPKVETAIPGGTTAGPFTGDFILDSPVDYWTESPPAVAIAIRFRGSSGHISGKFIPAYEL